MRRRVLSGMLGVLVAGVGAAQAEPCRVSSSAGSEAVAGSLPALIRAVAQGACASSDTALREQYASYLHTAQSFHVIEWTQSMDIVLAAPLPHLQGYGGRPLILRVASGATVRILGSALSGAESAVTLAGGAGPVILDGLTLTQFPGIALDMVSEGNTLLNSRVLQSGAAPTQPESAQLPGVRIRGRDNQIVDSEIAEHAGPGLLISEDPSITTCSTLKHRYGAEARIRNAEIHDNGGDGVIVDAFGARIHQSAIYANARHGVFVHSESIAVHCAEQHTQPVVPWDWHTAQITETRFWENDAAVGLPIAVSQAPLPPPVDLIVVSPPTAPEWVLVGNVSRSLDADEVWQSAVLDFSALHIELFLDGGRYYVMRIEGIDPSTRQFTVHLPKTQVTIDGQVVVQPRFTATAVDTEHGNTSPFAGELDTAAMDDWDRDGLSNAEEDQNHDGQVDRGEPNPRLADSDGDGLSDGDERLLQGVAAVLSTAATRSAAPALLNPQGLDPTNPDSDGDCLPDGLEAGVDQAALTSWQPAEGSVLLRPRLVFSPTCLALLARQNILQIANATPWDPSEPPTPDNVTALFDTDPKTRTDPTNPDSDGDGLRDGAEDWNVDGARSAKPLAGAAEAMAVAVSPTEPIWLETDPTRADSDSDGLPDGEEGDRDGDVLLAPRESDPLRDDTDGDGVSDADEVRTYGTLPNQCDTDGDGLGDGLETGTMHPHAATPDCAGLSVAGSDFESLAALDPLKADSDNDGLDDGVEDANANGRLDAEESDPTVADTDADGLSDYLEATGDLDQDGRADVQLSYLSNGSGCMPPALVSDVDCDGLPNARDADSDNDECPDAEEGLAPGDDLHELPAAFNAAVKACRATAGGGGAAGPAAPALDAPAATDDDPIGAYYAQQIKGGGGCSLVVGR